MVYFFPLFFLPPSLSTVLSSGDAVGCCGDALFGTIGMLVDTR